MKMARLSLTYLLSILLSVTISGQNVVEERQVGRTLVPFSVGERLTYDVRFGPLRVGTGSMSVEGIEPVRGIEAWHTVFSVKGGTFFYNVDDKFESWFDTRSFASLRHIQDIDEGKRERTRTYEIFPERGVYVENDEAPKPTVKDPLDDGSFLYFIRTVPFSVGQTYEFGRYFRPDRNPVKIRVLRKERIEVPAGTFNTIVIQPIIKTRGIFSEKGRAEIWLTDDDKRIMVQMKSTLSFGSLNLYLRSYQPGSGSAKKGQ